MASENTNVNRLETKSNQYNLKVLSSIGAQNLSWTSTSGNENSHESGSPSHSSISFIPKDDNLRKRDKKIIIKVL